jgi:hypothetical protein
VRNCTPIPRGEVALSAQKHQNFINLLANSAEGGQPCESAYKLLMRYATSEEKMEALARCLEEGCVPSSGGGCKVKNETVSQALLDIYL